MSLTLPSDVFQLVQPSEINLSPSVRDIIVSSDFHKALEELRKGRAFLPAEGFSKERESASEVKAIAAKRKLKSGYNLPAKLFFSFWADLAAFCAPGTALAWQGLVERLCRTSIGECLMKDLLVEHCPEAGFSALFERLETEDPHAIYPTSLYRDSEGSVTWSADERTIHGVMNTSTMTEIQIVEDVLNPSSSILQKVYQPLGRCVAVVDERVADLYGKDLRAYFRYHNVKLQIKEYRAMEVDKGIRTVERMMGDFKQLGVSRNEPVLVIGGGVLADTAGLACALYHRNTPYVMLSTSIVSGIDAGPSPRTCCDGFGYKNLFGAYHAPILAITDRTFFKTLRPGWLRHGVAEIVKMAVVKDERLFKMLEEGGSSLLETHFGASATTAEENQRGQQVIAAAMRCYVEAEYGNLYETHQCRPHAYGHTWSPGFEIPAGMLHGHAVGCGMGYGAYLSFREGWITADEMDRIHRLISNFGLSLYHPVMDEQAVVVDAQQKMVQKRGGNLAAPIPKGGIGSCGYLNDLSFSELRQTLDAYKERCQEYPREGLGIEAHCSDVGLEDPSETGSEMPDNVEPLPKIA